MSAFNYTGDNENFIEKTYTLTNSVTTTVPGYSTPSWKVCDWYWVPPYETCKGWSCKWVKGYTAEGSCWTTPSL